MDDTVIYHDFGSNDTIGEGKQKPPARKGGRGGNDGGNMDSDLEQRVGHLETDVREIR